MVLADQLDGDSTVETAVDCYRYWLNWSTGKYGLSNWLTMLRTAVGSGLRSIIWDNTDFGIPWELFRHDMVGNMEWLGAAVQVIRWTTVHDPNRHNQFSAEAAQPCGGNILYYEDPAMSKPKYSIRDAGRPGDKAAPDMEALLQELADESKSYGLVYVRGHGVHSESLSAATLAGICLANLEGRALPALREAKSVVILNACNSARPVIDKYYADGLNRNFAEIFLRQRASAVVATSAEVPIFESAAMAQAIVNEARHHDVSLPTFLRRRRAVYAQDVPAHTMGLTAQQKAAIRAFIYVSMFTYFGHPDAVLRLAAQ